jgi:hypothetical protein
LIIFLSRYHSWCFLKSYILTNIITNVSNNAPSVNETTALNSTFNLSEFVPNKPFINYSGSSGLNGQVIVFPLVDAIPLSSDTLDILSKIIQPSTLNITGGELFLNPDGPNSIKTADGIYISCKPTGSSEENTNVSYTNDTTSFDFSSIFSSSILRGIMMAIIFIVIFFIIGQFLKNYVNS